MLVTWMLFFSDSYPHAAVFDCEMGRFFFIDKNGFIGNIGDKLYLCSLGVPSIYYRMKYGFLHYLTHEVLDV